MTNNESTNDRKVDSEERTAKFGEAIIESSKSLPKSDVTRPPITQLVKCGTSVGATIVRQMVPESRRNFKHKIGICQKGSKETKHSLRMVSKVVPEMEPLT